MARLPSAEDLGALPSAASGRSIARYDVSGYARGAAAMADGLNNLGRGVGKAADTFGERSRLEHARADADYFVAAKALRRQAGDEADPGALAATYPKAFRDAQASAALQIEDPEQRRLWSLQRAADVDGHVVQTLDDARALRKQREVDEVTGQLETLKTTALDDEDEAARTKAIDTGNDLIFGLHGTGAIDDAQARAMREGWAKSYAEGRLGRLPPDERIATLESGTGIAEFVPLERRAELIRIAQADKLDLDRKAQSDAGVARFVADRDIADDLQRMQATGHGLEGLTPQRIDETLGAEARRAWQTQRDDAFSIWQATHDFATLTEAEIEARVAEKAPKEVEVGERGEAVAGFEASSSRERAIYDQVHAKADAVRQLRLTDPAASVADDPNVKAAQEAFDPQKPETALALIDARLAAQVRAGIEKPAVATLAEIKDLFRRLYDAVKADVQTQGGRPELVEKAQAATVDRIQQTYGPHVGAVIDDLVRHMGLADRPDTSGESQGQNENGFNSSFVVPAQWVRPRGVPGPISPPFIPVTPNQTREASEFFNEIERNSLLPVMRLATELLRNWIQNTQSQDEPNGVKNPPYPGANTDDPNELVDRSIQPAPPSNDKPLEDPLGSAAAIAAGTAVLGNVRLPEGLSLDELTRFLNDQPQQNQLLQEQLGELFELDFKKVQDISARDGSPTPVESMTGYRHYSGGSHRELNAKSREGRSSADEVKLIELIGKGIDALPVYDGPIQRAPYRDAQGGDKLWNSARIGENLELGYQLQSFTTKIDRAVDWSMEARTIVSVLKPTSGAFVGNFSRFPGEEEVLLRPGLSYKVIDKREMPSGGKTLRIIYLEIVK